ncbi:MAG: fibrobacter succinogenes major paralogous domain-containing protein [Flavobacteriales bacterium]|nr:fibrobacter succinogenes major paralogous domain-containing protein [Flavobacteriales bacterium]
MRPLLTICLLNASLLFMLSVAFSGCNQNDDPEPLVETVTDIDGNVYPTVTIGDQVWMAENLKVTRYRNGDPISQINDDQYWSTSTEGSFCSPDGDLQLVSEYGRLYNGYAITDSRGLAPEGWHVATDAEWTSLVDFAGGETEAGGNLKEIGFDHWLSPNTDATDEFGFGARSAGVRLTAGDFVGLGNYGCFWSSSFAGSGSNLFWVRCMLTNNDNVDRRSDNIGFGFAVRCVKN